MVVLPGETPNPSRILKGRGNSSVGAVQAAPCHLIPNYAKKMTLITAGNDKLSLPFASFETSQNRHPPSDSVSDCE
jgi:hypothetical protein